MAQMMTTPNFPNAAMTQWITYIQLFTFEIQHRLGILHQAPNGLSHRPPADGDSEYSDDEVDIEDGIKLAKAFVVEVNELEYDEQNVENGLQVWEELSKSKLE